MSNINPITRMNEVVSQAASDTCGEPGFMLVSNMLKNLVVVGIMLDTMTLILKPSKPEFQPTMMKRHSKILTAIKRICPEVSDITIIKGN